MPKVLDSEFTIRKPYVQCRVRVGRGKDAQYELAEGVGFAKAASGDQWNIGYGKELAEMRALREAYSRYYKAREVRLLRQGDGLTSPPECANIAQDGVIDTNTFFRQMFPWLPDDDPFLQQMIGKNNG